MALYGYKTAFSVNPVPDSQAIAANERGFHIQRLHEDLKTTLETAMTTYKAYADNKRREGPIYDKCDLIMLDVRNIWLKVSSQKLGTKRIGPYKVVRKLGSAAYALDSPS